MRREHAQRVQQQLSQRRACAALGFSRASVRYRARRPSDQPLRGLLRELATQRRRFGYRHLICKHPLRGCLHIKSP